MALIDLMARIRMQGAKETVEDLKKVGAGAEKSAKSIKGMGDSVSKAEGHLRSFGNMALKAAAASAVVSVGAFAYASQYDSLSRALATVSENAVDLTGKLGRLQEIAKLPGLNFAQAAQGVVTLQSAGLSASLAERSVKAFGNALASVGKGSSELEGVITALSQISSKGMVSAEEIGQLAERLPMIRKLLSGAFGTADTEKIQKMGFSAVQAIGMIVTEAEKLPRVTGGIGNALENLADLGQKALLPLGQGLAAGINGAMPALEKYLGAAESKLRSVGEYIAALGNSGVLFDALNKFGKGFGELVGLYRVNLESIIAGTISFVSNLPGDIAKIMKYTGDVLGTAIANIGIAFDYASKLVDSLGKRMERVVDRFQIAFKGLIETARNLSQFNLGGAIRSLGVTIAASTLAGPSLAVAAPEFAQMPKAPGLVGWSDAGRYEAMINAAKRPLSMLPDNLTFGGAERPLSSSLSALQGANEGALNMERLLAGIEKNTRETTDVLSLRKQGIGGGPLANLGVTATEINSARSRPNRTDGPHSGDFGGLPAAGPLEKAILNIVRQEHKRVTGGGRRIR